MTSAVLPGCQELHVDVAALESGSPSIGLLLITESSGGHPMHLTSSKSDTVDHLSLEPTCTCIGP